MPSRYSQLDDVALCRVAYAEQHDLTTTDLERELALRLEACTDGRLDLLDRAGATTEAETARLIDDADSWSLIADAIIENSTISARLLIVLGEHDTTDPEHLREILTDRR